MEGQEQHGEALASKKLQDDFKSNLHRAFGELTARGMEPNEACALGLAIAAGQADMPPAAQALYASAKAAVALGAPPPAALGAQQPQQPVAGQVMAFFSNPSAVHAAFWRAPVAEPCSTSSPTPSMGQQRRQRQQRRQGQRAAEPGSDGDLLDMEAMAELYEAIMAVKSQQVECALAAALMRLIEHIASTSGKGQPNPSLIRQAAVLVTCPLLADFDHQQLLSRIAHVLAQLPGEAGRKLVAAFATWSQSDMQKVMVVLQQYITLTLYHHQAITSGVQDATKLLGMFNSANDISNVLPYHEFYNDAVNGEDFNIKEDYRRWKSPGRYPFSFCRHPFVYDPASKARVLQYENTMEQFQEFESSMWAAMMGTPGAGACPYLVLRVRRGNDLLRDTLVQINRAKESDSLKKPLKVAFVGEEGVDEGGVQKEFFQLLVRVLFNPEFGMFVYDEASHLHWFRPSRLDLDMEFELIGILIGLAIYNSHILEFQFPMVLYKQLMGACDATLEDLAELHPDVASNLNKLLAMSEADMQALGLTFQVESEVGFGEMETVDLMTNGGDIAVTTTNREQYVQLYSRHLLEGSIERQFGAFRRGFLRLCDGAALQFFRPPELEQLICGGRELDLEALEGATLYDDGYTAQSQVVRWFWQVVHNNLNDEQKKRLLFFITGSDRVPIKGLAHLSPAFVISRNGPHSERLPTAHTCFNHLLLPAYKDRDTLQRLLLLAIENGCEGFGLM